MIDLIITLSLSTRTDNLGRQSTKLVREYLEAPADMHAISHALELVPSDVRPWPYAGLVEQCLTTCALDDVPRETLCPLEGRLIY